MKNKTNTEQIKKLLFIGIPVLLLLLLAGRFAIYYMRSDGFSGISMLLPFLLIGFLVFAFATSACFSAWVYQDCKKRSDDGILWAVIVFVTTPFIGMLVYLLRRPEIKRTCSSCGHKISLTANYCEDCGNPTENMEVVVMEKKTHHLKLIAAGVISVVLMLSCLTVFIVSAATEGNLNTDLASNEKVWNTGVINMNYETNLNGVWKLSFKTASDGFVRQSKIEIKDATAQKLYADIHCENIPEDATLTLWIVQDEISKSIDVTELAEPLEYSLDEFKNGTARVRLEIKGVENVTSEILVK